jgi:FtsH-binding integral membrane protein
MALLDSKERKEERLSKYLEPNQEISRKTYNLILGAIVLWGLLVNLIMCSMESVVAFYVSVNPIVFIIGYFVICFLGILIAVKSDTPLISFIGYNMVCLPIGVVVSACVYAYGGLGCELVQQAFLITCVITGIMVIASVAFPDFFSKLGGTLLVVLICLIITEIVLLILGIDQIVTSWIAAILFSLYIGYDIHRSQQFPASVDNAVDCALDIYLDIINLFLRILRILGKLKSKK